MSEAPVRAALAIRPLTLEELPLCEPYGRAFHAEKDVPGEFSLDVFLKNWTAFLTQYHGVIVGLWDEGRLVGGLGGMIVPDLTTGVLTATEFFLYIDPAFRSGDWWLQLIAWFRAFGKAHGACRFRPAVTIPKGEDFDRTVKVLIWKYRKMGARPVEIAFDGPI